MTTTVFTRVIWQQIEFQSVSTAMGTKPSSMFLYQHPALLLQIGERYTDGVELKLEIVFVDLKGPRMGRPSVRWNA